MRRFFIEDMDERSASVRVTGEELKHLKKVLRLRPGSPAAAFDGRGLELTGIIESVGADCAIIRVEGRSFGAGESPLGITLVQGLVKGSRPELIVQKATELGVRGVHFYSSGRTIPVLREERSGNRLARLRRVAVEAAKQCGRTRVPLISFPGFDEALSLHEGGLKLLFWEGERSRTVKEALRAPLPPLSGGVVMLAGPEGGLSAEDAAKAAGRGFTAVSLGPRVLRAETAALAAVSIVQYELGDMS